MGPVKKYFGSLSLDGISQAVKQVSSKVDVSEKYGKQLKVSASMWDDGGVSIDIWDGDTKESIKLGNLRVSQFEDNKTSAPAQANEQTSDLPF